MKVNQKQLQELLGIRPGSMSEMVIKLESKGLVSRAKDESDKRVTRLTLTKLINNLEETYEHKKCKKKHHKHLILHNKTESITLCAEVTDSVFNLFINALPL